MTYKEQILSIPAPGYEEMRTETFVKSRPADVYKVARSRALREASRIAQHADNEIQELKRVMGNAAEEILQWVEQNRDHIGKQCDLFLSQIAEDLEGKDE